MRYSLSITVKCGIWSQTVARRELKINAERDFELSQVYITFSGIYYHRILREFKFIFALIRCVYYKMN
jgi:hypothetical protein